MTDTEKARPIPSAEYNEFLERILANLTVSIAVVSPQLVLLKVNSMFCKLFHLSDTPPENVLLQNLDSDFWRTSEALPYLTTTFEEGTFDGEKEFKWYTETGHIHNIHLKYSLLGDTLSKEPKILLTFSDVTEARENENGRNERIRFLMHELRNPLSNISLCIELLADSTKENNQEDTELFLSKAANSVQRMKQLINDLNTVRQTSAS